MFKRIASLMFAFVASFGLVSLAHADSAAAVTAITGAQTDSLAVVAALLAMGIAVWAASYLYKKFFK